MKYCERCGQKLLDEAIMCPACGALVKPPKQPNKDKQKHSKRDEGYYKTPMILFFMRYAIHFAFFLLWILIVLLCFDYFSQRENVVELLLKSFGIMMFPLVWLIPSYMYVRAKERKDERVPMLFKVFVFVFCSFISGTCLVFRQDYLIEEKHTDEIL